jgi:periplasmic copper chaperone A
MRMKASLFGLSICLLLSLSSVGALAQTGAVQVKDVWARATPGGAQTAAVYATLQSPAGDELTAASTPVAKEAQLHQMAMEGGVMKMRQIEQVDLPAGQPVTLKPGGYHIMLVGILHPLVEGQTFPMTLTFAKAGTRDVTVAVQKIGAMGPADSSNMLGKMPGMSMPMHH